LFAYGSLIYRPGFSAAEVVVAALDGYGRRFWQGSPDHRGTPELPGRVVTLVPAPGERCLGLAYRLPADGAQQILAELDWRERAGFERVEVELELGQGRLSALSYLARSDNPHYLGPASLSVVAGEIAVRRGPSGSNLDYLRQLARALRRIGVERDHVFEVERELEGLLDQGPPDRTT